MRFKPGDLVAWECVCDITVERTIELGIIKKFTGKLTYPIIHVLTPEGTMRFTKDELTLISSYG
jgi:hypothetical protein